MQCLVTCMHANQKAIVCPGRCHCRVLMNGHSLEHGPEHEHGRGKWIEAEREKAAVGVVKRRWIHFVLSFALSLGR